MVLDDFQRVTIKLGTSVVTGAHGNVERQRLDLIVRDISELIDRGKEVLVVTSGAVGLGRKFLPERKKESLVFRQACASVGQNLLMTDYQKLFAKYGHSVAQVLITADDLSDRKRYLNLREMLNELLAMKIVPIINENDSVSTMELAEKGKAKVFGDNDKLSALVASKLGAEILILLTDVDGIYDKNPSSDNGAKVYPIIDSLDKLKEVEASGSSAGGRGGMESKIQAIQLASLSGIRTIVASGMTEGVIEKIFTEESGRPGTMVPSSRKISSRQKWIGFSSGIEGIVCINDGAQKALESSAASLLPVGIVSVKGEFKAGDVISIQNSLGQEVARGMSNYSSDEASSLVGKKGESFEGPDELVHRDRLVVFQESRGE